MSKKSTSILARRPNPPDRTGRGVSASAAIGPNAPFSETAVAAASSTVLVTDSMVARGSAADIAAAGSSNAGSGGAVSAAGANELAELPHWPIGLDVPGSAPPPRKPLKNAAILAWVPPQAKRIRAVLLIRANTDSKHFGEHAALRRVAARHEMAVVYEQAAGV